MEKDTAVFEEAFDELEKEGYFKDLEKKIKQLRASPTTSKASLKAHTTSPALTVQGKVAAPN